MQERLQAAAQQAYDDTPDYSDLYPIPSNGAASFDWNMFRKTRVAHLQRFLGDLPSLTAKVRKDRKPMPQLAIEYD